jgi:hypothetical protein
MDSKLEKISSEIEKLRNAVECLKRLSDDLPALDRNLCRMTASIKMLELNFVDPLEFGQSR